MIWNHQQIVGLYSYVTSVKLLWYEIMNKLDCIPMLLRLRLYDLKWSTNCWSHHCILETYVLKSISFYGCQNKVRWKILLIIKNSYMQKRFKFLHVEVFYQRFYASCHWDYMLVERIQFICYAANIGLYAYDFIVDRFKFKIPTKRHWSHVVTRFQF